MDNKYFIYFICMFLNISYVVKNFCTLVYINQIVVFFGYIFWLEIFESRILYVYERCNAFPMSYVIEICVIKLLYCQRILFTLSKGNLLSSS